MAVMKHAKGWNVILIVLFFAIGACAQETVLHSFNDSDGNSPSAALIFDSAGNLYGTSFYGGQNGVGTVYELMPTGSGWKESVLYSFNNDRTNGYFTNASLVFDKAGNLYGTTFFGGPDDRGTVFELSPTAGGGWTETVLHSFADDGVDGTFPQSGLIVDSKGSLYGTASNGGANGFGMVYQLTPSGGSWNETILYNFNSSDGANPFGRLLLDAAGNLYGTTSAGGGSSAHCTFGCGTVFELSSSRTGWTEKILHNFTNNPQDGAFPYSGLIFDAAGNLYGTTLSGGTRGNNGTVFELLPTAGGLWREKTLHSFLNNGKDGRYSMSIPVLDAAGNLYGTTESGGANGGGAVFKLAPRTTGAWEETLLYSFSPNGGDAFDPAYGLVIDSSGNLYGTTVSGGSFGLGAVFEITP